MFKVKRVRTIDAVVAGWRPGKEPDTVGALILGLYDGARAARRRTLLRAHRRGEAPPGRLSRALRDGRARLGRPQPLELGRELEWVALRPELVVEIDFDHVSAGRIRHGAKLRRWREDKPPARVHLRSALELSGPLASAERRDDTATVAEEEYLQILFWLQEAGLPMTGANVARAMQLSAPTVHEMVGRLERDGYITRGQDRVIAFTDDGASTPRASSAATA